MDLFEINNVTFKQDNNFLLKNFNLTVSEPSVVLAVSRGRALTSTLARICAGILTPDEGEILFRGKKPENCRTRLSFIPSHAGMINNRSVRENIVLKVRYHPRLNEFYNEARVDEVLARFDLEAIQDNFPEELSSLQQKKVALARAFISEPGLIFINEPGYNLNLSETEEFFIKFEEFRPKNTTVIIFANSVFPECEFVDLIFALENSKVLAGGELDDVCSVDWIEKLVNKNRSLAEQ